MSGCYVTDVCQVAILQMYVWLLCYICMSGCNVTDVCLVAMLQMYVWLLCYICMSGCYVTDVCLVAMLQMYVWLHVFFNHRFSKDYLDRKARKVLEISEMTVS